MLHSGKTGLPDDTVHGMEQLLAMVTVQQTPQPSVDFSAVCVSCRVTLSITTYHPSSLVEVPPVSLPPLSEALTEQQHQLELDEQQRQVCAAPVSGRQRCWVRPQPAA